MQNHLGNINQLTLFYFTFTNKTYLEILTDLFFIVLFKN